MKRLSSVVLLLAIAVVAVLLYLRYPLKHTSPPSEPSSSNIIYNSTANVPSSQESSGINVMASRTDFYTLKEYDGIIGVFYNEESAPYQEIQVDVSLLPEADQQLLKDGIKVYSKEELNSKIEDYES